MQKTMISIIAIVIKMSLTNCPSQLGRSIFTFLFWGISLKCKKCYASWRRRSTCSATFLSLYFSFTRENYEAIYRLSEFLMNVGTCSARLSEPTALWVQSVNLNLCSLFGFCCCCRCCSLDSLDQLLPHVVDWVLVLVHVETILGIAWDTDTHPVGKDTVTDAVAILD